MRNSSIICELLNEYEQIQYDLEYIMRNYDGAKRTRLLLEARKLKQMVINNLIAAGFDEPLPL